MNRYLIAGLAGAIALVLAVNSGLADRLFNVDSRTTGTAGLSTDGGGELGPVEGAGRLVQRQDTSTASAGQNTGNNGSGNTSAGGNNTGGSGQVGNSGGSQTTTPPASTQPPANLEAIPALW